MSILWIVIADVTEARIYASTRGPDLILVESIAHAEGRQPFGSLAVDKPTDVDRERFATALAEVLDGAYAESRFDELALVMAPRLLHLVRDHLGSGARRAVVAELHRSLMKGSVDRVHALVRAARTPAPPQ